MIIEKNQKQVQTSGNIQSASCTIDSEDMRYIASLLRNNYSDTILATMREIVANAIDVSRGNRKPDVTLPTKIEPNFIVRDYGCGLSEEDMLGLYTKYGKSTKRDTNNAIGGFGIGRFAPLSYTESFIVISVNDKTKTSYSIRVDENDDTVVSRMSSEYTSESNGIYVQVPIQMKDIDDFNKTFKLFSHYLRDKIVLRNHYFDYDKPEFSNEVFDCFIGETRNYWNKKQANSITNTSFCLMGGILYPVRKSDKYQYFADGLVYKAQIGEFKLHHSREALEYNDRTVEALQKASDKIASSFRETAKKSMESLPTLYDATVYFSKTFTSVINHLSMSKVDGCLWRGHNVSKNIFDYCTNKDMKLYRKNDNGNITQRTLASEYRYEGTPSKDRFFVVDDGVLPRSPMNRLSFLTKDQTAVLITKPDEKDLERVKLMNNSQVKKLSDLPRVVTTGKGSKIKRGEVKKSDILKFDKSGYRWTQASYWLEFDEEIDPNQTYYYYVYYANKVEMNGQHIEPYTISNRLSQLKKIRKDLDQVYGVRKKALKKFEKLSNWIRLDEVEEDWIKSDKNLYQQKRHDCLEDLLEFAMRNADYRNVIEEICKKDNTDKVILNFKKLLDECKSLRANNKKIQINMSGIEIDMSKEEEVKSNFLNRYPMAQYCFGHHSDKFEQDFANYLANW